MQVVCPSCQRQIQIPDDMAGREGRCPGCSSVIKLRAMTSAAAAAAAPSSPQVGQPGAAANVAKALPVYPDAELPIGYQQPPAAQQATFRPTSSEEEGGLLRWLQGRRTYLTAGAIFGLGVLKKVRRASDTSARIFVAWRRNWCPLWVTFSPRGPRAA